VLGTVRLLYVCDLMPLHSCVLVMGVYCEIFMVVNLLCNKLNCA
jgi:hypothetical protein